VANTNSMAPSTTPGNNCSNVELSNDKAGLVFTSNNNNLFDFVTYLI
jgi:hypothetical protein